jgi:hypothetical protein
VAGRRERKVGSGEGGEKAVKVGEGRVRRTENWKIWAL